MPPRTKNQGESKQGLIITLVFFILATIGAGVAAYFGFAEQETLAKKAAEEHKTAEDTKNEREWYKFLFKMSTSYLGQGQTLEGVDLLGTQKSQFDSGGMKGADKDKDNITKIMKSLEAKYKWNGNQPVDTAESTINKLKGDYANLAKQHEQVTRERDKAKKDAQAKEEELLAARKDFDDQLKALTTKFQQDFTAKNQLVDQTQTAIQTMATRNQDDLNKLAEERKRLNDQIAGLQKEIVALKGRVKEKESLLEAIQLKTLQAPISMRTEWRIVRIDRRGTNPYINLGSADHVNPQLTFSIHGIGVDGRPNPEAKGTLEVVNVIGPHLSQTRITSVKDADRDPIIERDVIYNPGWDPNLKKHVAISGIVDLTGDGRDDLPEFIRSLERQNVVVDAYQDPKDGKVKGQMTYRTEFLIIGDLPESSTVGNPSEAVKNARSSRDFMQNEAKKYGVRTVSLLHYLDMTGFRRPHSMREIRTPSYSTESTPAPTPKPTEEKPVPPAMPDK
jgi:predicted  nucleic acid-binding Zn-ribbon protein